MPTYEYRCRDCGDELEAQQAFTDDPLTECPSCRGVLKKLFGSVGIAFKGSGFYKNDTRGSSTTTKTDDTTKSGDSTKSSESAASSSDSSSKSEPAASTAKKADSSPGTGSGGSSTTSAA